VVLRAVVDAHGQAVTNHYTVAYPAHEAREDDPHYRDFDHFRRAHIASAVCALGAQIGFDQCGGGLELHHAHVEFALMNSVDLAVLERAYPGVSNPDELGAWVESGENLVFYCEKHHRGHGGVHHASASDFEAERFIRNLVT
jgi:hypothetical protein